jgi:hypothetical protein
MNVFSGLISIRKWPIFTIKAFPKKFPKSVIQNGHARRNWRMVALTQPTENGN